jgi:large conductance mechanosensitive channel
MREAFLREGLKQASTGDVSKVRRRAHQTGGGQMKDFKAFVLRGNVVDLAVGVVIGAAFGAIVTSLVDNIISPLISLINLPDFSKAVFEAGDPGPQGDFAYGQVINAVISFLVIALVVFFLVVKPLNRLMGRFDQEEEPTHTQCPHCLSSIPVEAAVCAYCTREVAPPRKRPARR